MQRAEASLSRRAFLRASTATALGLAGLGCGVDRGPSVVGPSSQLRPPSAGRSGPTSVSIGTGSGVFTGLPEIQGIQAMNQPEGWGIGHAPLSVFDHDGQPIPILAEHLPSLTDGTWQVDPDGSMRVTWRLRRD